MPNRTRRARGGALAAALLLSGATLAQALPAPPGQGANRDAAGLRPVESFATIPDPRARSLALFEEAGRVITHPRCVNCHPATDRPLQGDAGRPHAPPVVGAAGGVGAPGMACVTCHGRANAALAGVSLRSVPGNPAWHLAPLAMAWEGRSLGDICRQVKDPARNGGRDLAALHEHMAHDDLVGWGWNPGPGRAPVPGTQAAFGLLIAAWIETGAECP